VRGLVGFGWMGAVVVIGLPLVPLAGAKKRGGEGVGRWAFWEAEFRSLDGRAHFGHARFSNAVAGRLCNFSQAMAQQHVGGSRAMPD